MRAKRISFSSGFTLIELMVVILIIGLLSAMIFKMFTMATRKSAKAVSVKNLELVRDALSEFYAEYGQYPPVAVQDGIQPVGYEYENLDLQGSLGRQFSAKPPAETYGLISYLKPRFDGGHQTSGLDKDTARDNRFKTRVSHFIDGIIDTSPIYEPFTPEGAVGSSLPYSNNLSTVKDGWNHEIRYESKPPYYSYKLWSKGDDGKDFTADDIHRDGLNSM